MSARGWERLLCLCPRAAGARQGCNCCTPSLVLAASIPSCTLHQLVSRLALLCLAKLFPPPSLRVLLYVPSPAAGLQPSGSRGAGSPQWGGSASAGCSAIHRWVLCQSPPQHLHPAVTLPLPAGAQPWRGPAHLCARRGSARLPGDYCHGTRVTLGVHPIVLAARSTPGARAGASSPMLVHVMGYSSGL